MLADSADIALNHFRFIKTGQRVERLYIQILAVSAAHAEFRPVFEDDEKITVRPGLELLDAIDVHDCSPVNAGKSLRVELLLEHGERFSNEK